MEKRLGHAQIIYLMKFHHKTYFMFNGTVYEQVEGAPVGSPILELTAEAVIHQLDLQVFRHSRPKVWIRYVNDTVIRNEPDKVKAFREYLDVIFVDTQITTKEEEKNQITSLDILVSTRILVDSKLVFRNATNLPDEIPDTIPSTVEAVSTAQSEVPPPTTPSKRGSTVSLSSPTRSSSAASLKDESPTVTEQPSKDKDLVKVAVNETSDTTASLKKKRPLKKPPSKMDEKSVQGRNDGKRRGNPEALKRKINISAAGDLPMDQATAALETGFDNVAINWEKASFRLGFR
nr:unnamed protein product [Spirometra erinaceieuropaei]